MQILVATDSPHVAADVTSALAAPDVQFTLCSEGREVSARVAREDIDLCILDLQIGSMGGMAVAMALRLDASDERLPEVPVLMLLDRVADVHLAKRSAADGWLVKPFDALTLKRAVKAVLSPAAEPVAAAEAEEEVPVAG